MAAAVAAVLGVGGSALAQSQLAGGDGIAASPKVRAQLNDRRATTAVVAPVKTPVVAEKKASSANTNIAASPKVKSQLNERGEKIEIAPVK